MAANAVRRHLASLVYLGPLRDYPERLYVFTGNPPKKVGKTGSMLPDILFKDKTLLRQVNEYLDRFALGCSIVIDESPALPDVFQLRLVDKENGLSVSITDAGFGVSQVLPVIVQSMLARRATLCVEQPEIHLHPTLQSELGSLLATCIKEPFDNQFIIETHSEHIMLHLQKLIRNQTLSSTDVSVVYIDRSPDGSKCLPLRLDEDGRFIDRWPGGFFEEGYREIFD
jgi:predicted ATPase